MTYQRSLINTEVQQTMAWRWWEWHVPRVTKGRAVTILFCVVYPKRDCKVQRTQLIVNQIIFLFFLNIYSPSLFSFLLPSLLPPSPTLTLYTDLVSLSSDGYRGSWEHKRYSSHFISFQALSVPGMKNCTEGHCGTTSTAFWSHKQFQLLGSLRHNVS